MPPLVSPQIEISDDFEAVQRLYVDRGWSDGLPVAPPTPQRVEAMLAATNLDSDHVVAEIPPIWGAATVEKLAINAVMAGCLPEYLPVLIAAVEAIADPVFNLYAIQATTHPCAPLLIINGPIREALGMNYSSGSFGPGWRANATIGRAMRLVLLNVGGGYPGVGDMSTQGAPSKFSYCVAENEEENPWEPLHVERGFRPDQSAVTVMAGEPPHNINDHSGRSADDILTIRNRSQQRLYGRGNPPGPWSGPRRHNQRRRVKQKRCRRVVASTGPDPPGALHPRYLDGTDAAHPGRSDPHDSHPR